MAQDERFTTALNDEQRELLALLAEEAGEAIQAVGKCLRHGLWSSHPDYGNVPNTALLEREIGHVCAAIDLLAARHIISAGRMHGHRMEKLGKVKQFLHFWSGHDVTEHV